MDGSIINSLRSLKRSFRELHAALYFSTSPAFSPTPERIFLCNELYKLRLSSIGMSDWLIARIFSAAAASIGPALDIFHEVKTFKGNQDPLSTQSILKTRTPTPRNMGMPASTSDYMGNLQLG